MYRFLLCWRYLRTRYIALASIISVTLGVATMIVVNSVMAGFSHEMHVRLHGILSDIVIETVSASGIYDSDVVVQEVQDVVGDDLAGITKVVHVPAMLSFKLRGEWVARHISLIGIDEQTHAGVSDFGNYLLHPANRDTLTFNLRDGGYDSIDQESGDRVSPRTALQEAGWPYRRQRFAAEKSYQQYLQRMRDSEASEAEASEIVVEPTISSDHLSEETSDPYAVSGPVDPYAAPGHAADDLFDESTTQHPGVILGIAIASMRHRTSEGRVEDYFMCLPGDDVNITFPSSGTPPQPVTGSFTITDFYESKMNEYDSSFAFVPIHKLQEMRGMIDPETGAAAVTSIQIKLRETADLHAVCAKLRSRFPAQQHPYRIQTWQEMQGPLLAAVRMETVILNILLFLIIAVAGFGILATFFMIVVEKTRDIGVLKSLGAPGTGVMSIFLSYGLSLGSVGSGVGMILGLSFVYFINEIATGLEWLSGREVFDPTIYYFQEIPTIVQPFTVGWIALGAVAIAVAASILPAIRAAKMHPVEALRYE